MMNERFNLDSFNVIEDDNYYYFFRALNMGDNNDIETGMTLDENSNILRIRTDRERYQGKSKYSEDANLSLEEIFDHIKMHHRKDTNCISLTSNANVALMYGRGNYKDKYAIVRVPKKEKVDNVVNAGSYMLEEIQKRIKSILTNNEVPESIKKFITLIETAKTQNELNEIMNNTKRMLEDKSLNDDFFEKGIEFENTYTNSLNYKALNDEQNLEKNKVIAILDLLNKEIIPNVSNKFLIQTLGNAFSSLEITHYNDIQGENIINIPKEFIDIFSLLQQLPNSSIVNELKQEVINYINNNKRELEKFEYDSSILDTDLDYTIERMYELTSGNVNFYDAINLYKKSFYLAKSRLRTINLVSSLRKITNNNPKYSQILDYMINNTYGVEPQIFSRVTGNKKQVSESVSLDLTNNDSELFNFINNLNESSLTSIINNPLQALKYYLINFKNIGHYDIDKIDYYANAIIDIFDWDKLGVVKFSIKQRNDIVNKLKEYDIINIYNELKLRNIKEKDIANILLTIIIRGNDLSNININETFTVEELEDFLGYYKIKQTQNLKLRSYQASAVKNIDKAFQNHQFTAAVLPTGAGKSFVALAEMLKYKDKEILYLAPNDEILNQIEDYIVEYIHGNTLTKTKREIIKEVFPNLKLKTYSSLLSFNQREIIEHTYDFIIFDELHRSGANDWHKHVLELLKNQTYETKVLGITATPIRDMDGKNMAEEWARYFGYTEKEILRHQHLAINMDLEEAIRLGYVVNPKIVQCEYTLQDKNGLLDNLIERINSLEDEEKKNTLIKKFEVLRRQVNNAEGVSNIIGNHIKQGGKYIVFCPVGKNNDGELENDDAIEKYIEELKGYLKEFYHVTDEELESMIEFSSMLGKYSKSLNRRNLEKFESQKSSKTKFMVVINKLNEGVHVNDIDGIIWFRPLDSNSRILYLQQLGRIISSMNPNNPIEDEKRPMVIDLVNNTLRVNLNTKKTWTDDLDKLKLIIDWIKEHNDQIPDLNSNDKVERNYGISLKTIKEKYLIYINDLNKINELEEIEKQRILQIINLGKDIDLWNFEFPERIQNVNINSDIIDEMDYDLFEITGILKDFCDLSQEVETIDNGYWNKMYKYAKIYYEHHGDLNIPYRFKTNNGYNKDENGKINLGNWISDIRNGHIKTDDIRRKLLNDIGMVWEKKTEFMSFEEVYKYAKKFYEYNGHLNIPESFKTNNGYEKDKNGIINLGRWIKNRRNGVVKVTNDQKKLLDDIGMVWKKKKEFMSFEEMYKYAKIFYEHNGHLNIPESFKTNNGYEKDENGIISLGSWIGKRRRGEIKVGDTQRELLNKIGMTWEKMVNMPFEEMYEYAKIYYRHNGHLQVPLRFKTNNGYEKDKNGIINLGRWISERRIGNIKVDSMQRKLLDDIGMVWDVHKNKDKVIELCEKYGINHKKEKNILKKSYHEVYAKIKFLEEHNLPIIVDGKVHEIFFMSDINMQVNYNISLSELINTYSKGKSI